MKRFKILLLITFVISLITGCEKFLDQQPISDLSNELFWRTPDDARLGVTGIYDGVQSAIGTGSFTDWGDARSDNFTYGGTGDDQISISLNGLTAVSPYSNWNDLYITIGRANSAIKYIPRIQGIADVQKNDYLAQAYALRAFMYFYAVRVWGDVPVVLEPFEDLNQQPDITRVSASTIIDDVILKDLNTAYTLSDKLKINYFEISTGAILAMLADVYIWKKDYPKVIEETTKLMQLNRYGLVAGADWKKLFTDPGTTSIRENIWSLNWSFLVDQQGNGNNNFQRIGLDGNTSPYKIDSTILTKFESNKNDIRRKLTYDTLLLATSFGVDRIGKFYPLRPDGRPDYPTRQLNEAKIPIYRYADILLLRAEALNKTNNPSGAVTIVNQIRTRANAGTVLAANYPTERDVETLILDERQKELFAEGRRWFDLIRTGRVLEVMDPLIRERQTLLGQQPTGFTDPRKILFPISRDALNRNTTLIQNPPYSE
ncbi:MAG TPA: RagB/SusD family nutrient uptake outer membrane protein [Pelobium sp.]|nr:RagB/SusD family nutrient uptake outer membrane protein [Pelobium sp.]